MATTFPRSKRNWVAIAVNIVGGIYPAARICHVRPVTMKRWYWRGWVELVDKAILLARASGLCPLQVIGFADMPSLGKRRRRVRRRPLSQRRDARMVVVGTMRGRRRYRSAVWVGR